MRICILGNASSIHVVRWANGLSSLGNEVFLFSADQPGIHLIDSKVNLNILRFRPPFGYYLNYRQARKLISQIKPDILNTHYASGYGTLSRLIGFYPTLLSVWGSDIFDFPNKSWFHKRLITKNLKSTDWIASTSQVMKFEIEKYFKPRNPIFITPFGVDLEQFKPIKNNDITIGIVKTIDQKYGHFYLIKAMRIVIDRLISEELIDIEKKIHILVVGDGPQRNQLEKMISALGLTPYVTITGMIMHSEVHNYYKRMNICCFPSTSFSESFGVSVIEASACEIPVIASNIGGLPEVVIDGETGYLVPPCDALSLAEKIYHLIRNPGLRVKMGKQGRHFVSINYDWHENVQRMVRYFGLIVKEKNINKLKSR